MNNVLNILHKSSSLLTKIQNRYFPLSFWKTLSRKTQNLLQAPALILSFDCDTEDDAKVVWDVHSRLMDIGIVPVYAVPGELLKKGEGVYRKIYETGAEFINHGGREHTYFDTEKLYHASCFFYDQQSYDVLSEDIRLGHQTLQNILGITAKGWRTPHFGTFQNSEHLQFLYGVLRELDYTFSTSTSPAMAYRNGPLYKRDGIIEIPVTGIFSEPFNIMDTWAYFAAPDRTKSPYEYASDAHALVNFAKKYPLLINIYGDPSHIYDKPEFFQAMECMVQSAKNINYTQLLEITNICSI